MKERLHGQEYRGSYSVSLTVLHACIGAPSLLRTRRDLLEWWLARLDRDLPLPVEMMEGDIPES